MNETVQVSRNSTVAKYKLLKVEKCMSENERYMRRGEKSCVLTFKRVSYYKKNNENYV